MAGGCGHGCGFNTGVSSRGSVIDTDIRVDRRVMETNFFGSIQLTKGYKK